MKREPYGLILRNSLFAFAMGVLSVAAFAQQSPDLSYNPPIADPAYESGEGPIIGIDEAHANFHTANGRYRPFAKLMERDGYRVVPFPKRANVERLKTIDILVIANPLHKRNNRNWKLPTPSAFSDSEIESINAWVKSGGSLLLIADHMPFPGGAGKLAESFGFRFSNGFARYPNKPSGRPDLFQIGNGLIESAITEGRSERERVTRIGTFTGSAFLAPPEARAILRFGANAYSLEPKEAWKFNGDTPALKIEGWLQGAYMPWGSGRMAVFGEAAMFTAQVAGPQKRRIGMGSPHAPQNYQLLLNTMHWLSGLIEVESKNDP